MGRAPRSDTENGWHHVMNRGVDRRTVFFGDEDRIEFGRLLGIGADRFGVEVHAYCLMSNHFHLLLRCPRCGLSDFMQLLLSVSTRHTNDRIGRDGPLFRGRFRSVTVADDDHLVRSVRYIHRNALDLPGVIDPAHYRWSSHRTYLGHRRRPDWMHTDHVLDYFTSRTSFEAFVNTASCGTSAPTGMRQLLPTIALVLEERGDTLTSSRQGLARTLAAAVADRLGGRPRSDILDQLDYADDEVAIRRVRRRLGGEPALGELVDRIVTLL